MACSRRVRPAACSARCSARTRSLTSSTSDSCPSVPCLRVHHGGVVPLAVQDAAVAGEVAVGARTSAARARPPGPTTRGAPAARRPGARTATRRCLAPHLVRAPPEERLGLRAPAHHAAFRVPLHRSQRGLRMGGRAGVRVGAVGARGLGHGSLDVSRTPCARGEQVSGRRAFSPVPGDLTRGPHPGFVNLTHPLPQTAWERVYTPDPAAKRGFPRKRSSPPPPREAREGALRARQIPDPTAWHRPAADSPRRRTSCPCCGEFIRSARPEPINPSGLDPIIPSGPERINRSGLDPIIPSGPERINPSGARANHSIRTRANQPIRGSSQSIHPGPSQSIHPGPSQSIHPGRANHPSRPSDRLHPGPNEVDPPTPSTRTNELFPVRIQPVSIVHRAHPGPAPFPPGGMRMLPSRIIRLAPLAVLLALPAAGQARSLALEPCTMGGLPADARCGTLRVPEKPRPGRTAASSPCTWWCSPRAGPPRCARPSPSLAGGRGSRPRTSRAASASCSGPCARRATCCSWTSAAPAARRRWSAGSATPRTRRRSWTTSSRRRAPRSAATRCRPSRTCRATATRSWRTTWRPCARRWATRRWTCGAARTAPARRWCTRGCIRAACAA